MILLWMVLLFFDFIGEAGVFVIETAIFFEFIGEVIVFSGFLQSLPCLSVY
jgi:hypothetical protein